MWRAPTSPGSVADPAFFSPRWDGAVAPIEGTELWGWSGGWLAFGIGLMFQGIRTRQRLLWLTALGVIGLVCTWFLPPDR
jgi:hypothetical protein